MSAVNGIRIRGISQDADRVSVQSTHQDSHLLTRRRWKFLPAQWTEVTIERDELIVLKCNHGNAIIELKHMGGPHGPLVIDQGGNRSRLKGESTLRLELAADRAVFLHTANIRHPLRRETGVGVGAV